MILLPLALWHPYLICPPFWTAAAVGFRRQCQWVTGVFRPSLPSTQELAPRQVPGSVFFSYCPLILPHCQPVPTRFPLPSLPEPSSVTFFSFSVSHVASARLSRGRFSFHPVLYSYLRPLVLLLLFHLSYLPLPLYICICLSALALLCLLLFPSLPCTCTIPSRDHLQFPFRLSLLCICIASSGVSFVALSRGPMLSGCPSHSGYHSLT